nr:hypothetical protein [uncultured Ruegeria sp.]
MGQYAGKNRRMGGSYHGHLGHEQDGLAQLAQPSTSLAPPRIFRQKSGRQFAGSKANLPQACPKKGTIRSYGLIRRPKNANNALQISQLLKE